MVKSLKKVSNELIKASKMHKRQSAIVKKYIKKPINPLLGELAKRGS